MIRSIIASTLANRLVLGLALGLALGSGPAQAQSSAGASASAGSSASATSPSGLWRTVDDRTGKVRSLVRISEKAGVFTGVLEKRFDEDAKPTDTCTACTDDRKDKLVIGMELIRGVRQVPGEAEWSGGTILDPEAGKAYRVRLRLEDGGRFMQVRGYIGTPMIGRSQTWTRME